MITGLDAPMTGDGCRADLFEDGHRDALKAACAEDPDIWDIYANDFGPDGFDASIDRGMDQGGDDPQAARLTVPPPSPHASTP